MRAWWSAVTGVVLGVLRAEELAADPQLSAVRVMRPGPSTYRPFMSVEEMCGIMTERGLASSPGHHLGRQTGRAHP